MCNAKVIGLFFLLFLLSCEGSRTTAGGSGTETEATLSGIVLTLEGHPAANVRILLRAGATREKQVIDSARTDAQGHWSIDGVGAGIWSVEARSSSGDSLWGQQSRITVSPNDTVLEVATTVLQSIDSLYGVLLQGNGNPVPAGTEMIILGLGDTARTTTAGKYHFAQIPSGAHWIAVGSTILTARTGSADTLFLDSSIWLDDFEDDSHDLATYPGRWTGRGGWWYALQEDSTLAVMTMLQNDSLETGNHALHVALDLPSGRWALVGFEAFSDSSQPENWCALQNMHLQLRGNGTVKLEVQTAATLALDNENTHFTASLPLSGNWTPHAIVLPSLTTSSTITWAQACADVRFVNFVFSGTVNAWIDDLRLTP